MPHRVRNLGPYQDIAVVDIRGLYCYVSVEHTSSSSGVRPLAYGPWRECGGVRGEVIRTDNGRTLVLTQAGTAVYRTRIAKVHIVEPGSPFYQDLMSPLKVTMFVRPGTKVLY